MILNTKSGPFYFLISVIFFSVMEILVKFLSSSYPIGELVFFRGFFGLLPIIFIMPKKKFFQNFKTKKIKLHIFRTITGCFALISIFFGLKYLPLADAISITFAAPIFATIFSIFFLKEIVGKKRWFAVLIGFLGILIILKPGTSLFSIYSIFPILFCVGFAASASLIRILSKTDKNYLISFYYTAGLTLVSLFLDPLSWKIPLFKDCLLLISIGIIGSLGNIIITEAYRKSEISLITPIKYLNLIFAIVFGYFLFNEVPEYSTLIGSVFIIVSTVIIFIRERKLNKKNIIPKEL
ncbi:MAG: DMT family transporter [Pelagibacteraceae bacterium]|jgi:drug/metabolite transporter (DMT)-like permease|nr:DMT family transporter [Pelagibacteraceae bacterium]MBT7011097.1 DMT family transporter [Flavobacteriaceae bacterium]|tara:strand:+ start:2321 stop:3205 length:885 start_codon:yes stop_codon:yes gene_type:complete